MQLTKLGFHKIAVGAKKLLKGIQRENIIRMPGKLLPEMLAGKAQASSLPSLYEKMPLGVSRNVARDIEKSRPQAVRAMKRMGASEVAANKHLDDAITRLTPTAGKTLTPRGVNPGEVVAEAMGRDFSKLKPNQKRLMNALTLRHEAAESAVKDTNFAFNAAAQHRGPEVILKEHNQVRNLSGKGSKKVKKIFRQARTSGPEERTIQQNIPALGFEYGKSERLSRHAIKRISESLNKKMNPTYTKKKALPPSKPAKPNETGPELKTAPARFQKLKNFFRREPAGS